MTFLEDKEAVLFGTAFDNWNGDSLRYMPVGGAYSDKVGFVDYSDQARSLEVGIVIEQKISVEISKITVPVEPTAACRVQLPKVPGRTFKPINVGGDKSGNCWLFDLQRV